jgi:hypothetical protein
MLVPLKETLLALCIELDRCGQAVDPCSLQSKRYSYTNMDNRIQYLLYPGTIRTYYSTCSTVYSNPSTSTKHNYLSSAGFYCSGSQSAKWHTTYGCTRDMQNSCLNFRRMLLSDKLLKWSVNLNAIYYGRMGEMYSSRPSCSSLVRLKQETCGSLFS